MKVAVKPVAGSFRDPCGRVYEQDGKILRGVDETTFNNFLSLKQTPLFQQFEGAGLVVQTSVASDDLASGIRDLGWYGVLHHERVPLVSYPYEWSFSMLKDAALLQLELLEKSLLAGWTMKDSTPFNIQFAGKSPIFIDIPSFVPRVAGDYWRGYRQFCMLFLYPLMLKAHRDIDFNTILRSSLEGITPAEFSKYFSGVARLKNGVLSHVVFPAMMERAVERRERDNVPAVRRQEFRHSDAMVIGLVQSMRRIVERLRSPIRHTTWSKYATRHSYGDDAFDEKVAFVKRALAGVSGNIAWDIGSNTGTFSRLCAAHSKYVLAIDGDHDAVEQLYVAERAGGPGNVLPLYMNLANPSPGQGWAGQERAAFDGRNRPDLVICLALIHHMALSANVPIELFIGWLAGLRAKLIIEFVDRHDEMVEKLLLNKTESYESYNRDNFEHALRSRFGVLDEQPLKGGKRRIYFCEPMT